MVWRLQSTLASLDSTGERLRVLLGDGQSFDTDLVLSAAGLVANTQLAQKAGLATDVGIAVDHSMLTSDGDVYAIGDCASLSGQVFAYIEPIRRQAEAIAAHVAGSEERFMPPPPLVKVKTPSHLQSVCASRQGQIADDAWIAVDEPGGGLHSEIPTETAPLPVCGRQLASQAGGYYRRFGVRVVGAASQSRHRGADGVAGLVGPGIPEPGVERPAVGDRRFSLMVHGGAGALDDAAACQR